MAQPDPAASPPSATSPPKKRRRLLFRALVILILLLITAELGLRFIFGFGSPILYQADQAAGYVPQPNQDVRRFFARNYINANSMRCDEVITPRPSDTLRVFFIGDSITYGTSYVDQRKIFTSLVNDSLPALEHKPVEVLNMSAGGWSPRNEVGYLLSRGTFDANIVLIVLNDGDAGENFATFEENINFPIHRPLSAISEVWSRYISPRLFHRAIAGDQGTTKASPEITAANTVLNLQALSAAKKHCNEAKVLFGIVFVPFAGWHEDLSGGAHAAFQAWAQKNGAVFIDLGPTFEKEDDKKLTVDGMHLRPYGDQVVANEIVRQWSMIDAALAAMSTRPATNTSDRASNP